jgi:L-fucose mutarotase
LIRSLPIESSSLISALAGAGHGSRILLVDSDYPFSPASGVSEARLHLNLRPAAETVTDVLAAVREATSIEAANVMQLDDGTEPDVFSDAVGRSRIQRAGPAKSSSRKRGG